MATVVIPSGLQHRTGGESRLLVDAHDVRGLLRELDRRFPGLAEEIESGCQIAIDGEILPDAWLEALEPESEIHFLPQIGGGSCAS
jgi:molybdopterin converting factor small subunit